MKVITNKREVVGVIKTPMGNYPLLTLEARPTRIGGFEGSYRFHSLDDEGFETYIYVYGNYVAVPLVVPVMIDVKIYLTEEEAEKYTTSDLFSDESTTI